jgi:hypothetical protein
MFGILFDMMNQQEGLSEMFGILLPTAHMLV